MQVKQVSGKTQQAFRIPLKANPYTLIEQSANCINFMKECIVTL